MHNSLVPSQLAVFGSLIIHVVTAISIQFCRLPFYLRTAGVQQMRLLRRHSFIIIVVVNVVAGHVKSFQPQKQPFSLFENNTGQTDGRTD